MRRTLQQQIEANKRASLFYSFLIVLLLCALGTAIVGVWSPKMWYLGAGGSLALGLIMVAVAYGAGPGIVLSISGAQETDNRVLHNVAAIAISSATL